MQLTTVPHSRYGQRAGTFEVSFVPASRFVEDGLIESQLLLAVVQYGTHDPYSLSASCPSVVIPMRQLNEEQLVEVWTSSMPVVTGQRDGIYHAANGQALFGVCRLEEPEGSSLETITCNMYRNILRLVEEEGYPNLLRAWNYLSDINEEQDDLERYRHFCVGRYNAFTELDPNLERPLPAGSGVGTTVRGLLVYFVASREAGKPIENPRQVNAYDYPPQYGPRSPSFSRAMVMDWGLRRHLFLSGTASIVEHQTLHIGNVRAQLAETLRNVRALLERAANVAASDSRSLFTEPLLKVYIRHARDFPLIQELLTQELGEKIPIIYLNGDLCRRELLVEIEGIYRQ